MPEADGLAPYVFYGSVALIFVIPFLFRTTATFLVSLIGYIYPTFGTLVALYNRDERAKYKWLVYWLVYHVLNVIQVMFRAYLQKIPFYPLLTAIFLIALMYYPYKGYDNLAEYIYNTQLAPRFGPAATEVNEVIQDTIGQAIQDPKGFADQMVKRNENRLTSHMESLKKAFEVNNNLRETTTVMTDPETVRNTIASIATDAAAAAAAVTEGIRHSIGSDSGGSPVPEVAAAASSVDQEEQNLNQIAVSAAAAASEQPFDHDGSKDLSIKDKPIQNVNSNSRAIQDGQACQVILNDILKDANRWPTADVARPIGARAACTGYSTTAMEDSSKSGHQLDIVSSSNEVVRLRPKGKEEEEDEEEEVDVVDDVETKKDM